MAASTAIFDRISAFLKALELPIQPIARSAILSEAPKRPKTAAFPSNDRPLAAHLP